MSLDNLVGTSLDSVTEGAMNECVSHAENLYRDVCEWIKKHHPGLLLE